MRTVDPQLVEMAPELWHDALATCSGGHLARRLPSIFVGLRFALGIMWLTLIVAETIAAQSGIGYMAMQAREFMQIDVVVLAILIYALLGKLADIVARALERRLPRLASRVPGREALSDDEPSATGLSTRRMPRSAAARRSSVRGR